MPAGNITATLVDGVLTLSGDARNNDVRVTINETGGVSFASLTTTVNGQPAADVALAGTVTSIEGTFDRGRDWVLINGEATDGDSLPSISGGITLDLGRGHDIAKIRGLDIEGDVTINSDRGVDWVVLQATRVGGDLSVNGGRGRDRLLTGRLTVDGDLEALGGRGDDLFVRGAMTSIGGNDNVDGQSGRDRVIEIPETFDSPRAERIRRAIDRFFERGYGGSASTEQIAAYESSESPDAADPGAGTNPFPANSLDTATFPTGFPSVDPAEFTTTDSGLSYRIIEPGDVSRVPTTTDTVLADYQGVLLDGSQFDSSFDRGTPAQFPLRNVIGGWQEGVPLIGEGGRIQLLIPPSLAYGERGTFDGSVPPNATLFFNVHLISIVTV